jgi:hypothetical protein
MITLVTVPAEKIPSGEITKYFDSYREDFQKNIKDFKIIKASDDAKDYQTRMIAGASAYVYEFSGKITNIDYNFRQAYLLHPETKDLFIITCRAVPEAYNSLGKTITEVYDNFTFVTEPIKMEDKTEINLPGTEGVEVPSGFTLISNEFVDYYFFVPSDWTPTVNTGMSAAVSNKSSRTGASVVAFNTHYLSLDDYWTGYEEELKATFGEITYLSDTKYSASKVGGLDARAYSYKITQNGTEYVYTQNVLIYNGYVYIITFSCENGSFDSFSLDFNGILQNFKFKN